MFFSLIFWSFGIDLCYVYKWEELNRNNIFGVYYVNFKSNFLNVPCGLDFLDNSTKCKTIIIGCKQTDAFMVIVDSGDYEEIDGIIVVSDLVIEGENKINTNLTMSNSNNIYLFSINSSDVMLCIKRFRLKFQRSDNFSMFCISNSYRSCTLLFERCIFTQDPLIKPIYGQVILSINETDIVKTNNISFNSCDILDVVTTTASLFCLNYTDAIEIFNSSVVNVSCQNTGDYDSGCFRCHYLDVLNISYCSFRMCSSVRRGGFILARDIDLECLIQHSVFVCCTSKWGGTLCIFYPLRNRITNCSFIHCSAGNGCGALSCVGGNSLLNLTSCVFFNCSSVSPDSGYGYGGALEIDYYSQSVLMNCSFTQCTALRGLL
jgi:hypothetical protein